MMIDNFKHHEINRITNAAFLMKGSVQLLSALATLSLRSNQERSQWHQGLTMQAVLASVKVFA
jgi:hypothetical protein